MISCSGFSNIKKNLICSLPSLEGLNAFLGTLLLRQSHLGLQKGGSLEFPNIAGDGIILPAKCKRRGEKLGVTRSPLLILEKQCLDIKMSLKSPVTF